MNVPYVQSSQTIYISSSGKDFQDELEKVGVHFPNASQTVDKKTILDILLKPRPELENFTEADFELFESSMDDSWTKKDLALNILRTILPLEGLYSGKPFTGLKTFSPNFDPVNVAYYSASTKKCLNHGILSETEQYTRPNNDSPVVPNFFVKLKATQRKGSEVAGLRKIAHYGAIGSRAIYHLRNYGREPVYDLVARSFSFLYCARTISIFAHHVSPPDDDSTDKPHYHTTRIYTNSVLHSRDALVEIATVARNTMDLCDQYREEAIEMANDSLAKSKDGNLEKSIDREHQDE